MDYQIKLKFSCYTLADYEAIGSMEPHLKESVGPAARVDGHDVSPVEVSILISTSQPALTIGRVHHTLFNELSGRFRGDIESAVVRRGPDAELEFASQMANYPLPTRAASSPRATAG